MMRSYQMDSGLLREYTASDVVNVIRMAAVARETDINLDDDSRVNRSWNESHGSQVVPDAV
jgi:hypothetical protein